MRQLVFDRIEEIYSASPEYLWKRFPGYAVFRHENNKKWFALIADVERIKLGLKGPGAVYVMNVKINDPVFHDVILNEPGILPGYHMNKKHWVSVLLDGTVPEDRVFDLLDMSFEATK